MNLSVLSVQCEERQVSEFNEKSFSNTFVEFTKIYCQKRNYLSMKKVNDTGIDNIHWKCDCTDGSFFNGIRQNIFLKVLHRKSQLVTKNIKIQPSYSIIN